MFIMDGEITFLLFFRLARSAVLPSSSPIWVSGASSEVLLTVRGFDLCRTTPSSDKVGPVGRPTSNLL